MAIQRDRARYIILECAQMLLITYRASAGGRNQDATTSRFISEELLSDKIDLFKVTPFLLFNYYFILLIDWLSSPLTVSVIVVAIIIVIMSSDTVKISKSPH
ncbi:hypothetical protein ACTXT7_005701 [Hymenolepis weldensis]